MKIVRKFMYSAKVTRLHPECYHCHLPILRLHPAAEIKFLTTDRLGADPARKWIEPSYLVHQRCASLMAIEGGGR